jgi:hypothetical protein
MSLVFEKLKMIAKKLNSEFNKIVYKTEKFQATDAVVSKKLF